MIVWNKKAYEILNKVITNNYFWFILLEWPKHIWKTTFIFDIIKNFWLIDFLYVMDLSEYIWEIHSIKIDSNEIIDYDFWKYVDLWVRQMKDWLNKTSFSWKKILYIENIERATLASQNALLKILEEQPKNTMIIASTSSKDLLLDTIISRAFVIKFNLVSEQELESLIPKEYISKKDFLIWVSYWLPWMLIKLINTNFSELYNMFNMFYEYYVSKIDIYETYNLLSKIYKDWYIDYLVNYLIYIYEKNNDYEKIRDILKFRSLLNTNINPENLIFSICI